jgi:hypothetical protein
MTDDLARLVMKAAATELLYEEAAQIDREVQWLLAEMQRTPASKCRGVLLQRFLDLLQHRGEVAKKALIMRENSESGAAFAARIWPLPWQGQFDGSPSSSTEALSPEGRVVALMKMKKRHECDAGNRAISGLRRPPDRSASLVRDGCRDVQAGRIEVPEVSAQTKAARLPPTAGSECKRAQ